jgi:STE24 endopeptidase
MLGFSLFVAFLYLILRLSTQRWWMWGAGLAVSFIALIMLLGPLYIEPYFNEYKPMAEGPLKDRILSIARANGMDAGDVKQVDESKQTRRISANVSGLFGSSRIALNDNLLERASSDGVEAVMAHEIGHYVLNHQWQTLAYYALIFIFGFAAVNALFKTICRKRGSRWGIRGIDDYAGFPLLYAIGAVLIFLATPVFYKLTYTMEMEADLFAINATRSPDAWSEVALMGAEYRKLRPPPWEESLLNHHPSPYTRIDTAMRWKAENLPVESGD